MAVSLLLFVARLSAAHSSADVYTTFEVGRKDSRQVVLARNTTVLGIILSRQETTYALPSTEPSLHQLGLLFLLLPVPQLSIIRRGGGPPSSSPSPSCIPVGLVTAGRALFPSDLLLPLFRFLLLPLGLDLLLLLPQEIYAQRQHGQPDAHDPKHPKVSRHGRWVVGQVEEIGRHDGSHKCGRQERHLQELHRLVAVGVLAVRVVVPKSDLALDLQTTISISYLERGVEKGGRTKSRASRVRDCRYWHVERLFSIRCSMFFNFSSICGFVW